jgi:hypothetical protein
MSTQKSNDYLNSIDRAARRIAQNTTKTQEQLIMRAYKQSFDDAFSDYLKQLEKGKSPSQQYFMKCKLAYIQQLYNTMQSQSMICNEKIPKRILDQYAQVMKDITNNKDVIDRINKNVDVTSRNIVEQMTKGEIYKGGMGLDSRLWSSTNAAGRKIEDAVTSCLARGISPAEASKIISQFAKSGHHTWDSKKIREKLGSGYASKYGKGGLDYEALRLMRTTNTHMAQLSVMNSDKVNPYNQFVKYHTGHAGSRTCSMCRDRDGKIFPIHDAPLDHPNGLCWLSPVMSKDGKTELSLADMVDDMNDYFDGKPNSGVMEQWTGKTYPRRVEPKPQQPTEPPKPKPTTPKSTTIPKGHLYTEEQREQKYQELETHLLDGISSMLENELVNNKNKDNMIKPYAKTTVKGIIGNLRKYPTSIQDLYLHTAKDLKMNYTPDGAFYSPVTASIHFSVKKTNNDNRGAYGTVFHEWGHMIDWHFLSETGGTVTGSVKEEMYKIVKQDVEDRIKYQQKNSRVKINKTEAKKLVTNELNGATDAIAGVSDIYGGVTGNAVVGRWGHAKSYWTRKDKEAEVCSEAWADILQSYGIPYQSKYIEKYLPGGKAFVEKTVEELIEKIKRGEIK